MELFLNNLASIGEVLLIQRQYDRFTDFQLSGPSLRFQQKPLDDAISSGAGVLLEAVNPISTEFCFLPVTVCS